MRTVGHIEGMSNKLEYEGVLARQKYIDDTPSLQATFTNWVIKNMANNMDIITKQPKDDAEVVIEALAVQMCTRWDALDKNSITYPPRPKKPVIRDGLAPANADDNRYMAIRKTPAADFFDRARLNAINRTKAQRDEHAQSLQQATAVPLPE